MEVICINGTFKKEELEFYATHGVVIPKKDVIYSIRKIRNDRGTKGLLLNEIINPEVPIKTMMGGLLYIEPSWHVRRFSTLLGDKIEVEEQIEETI